MRKFFDRYFEGYTEETIIDGKKRKVKYNYEGQYYCRKMNLIGEVFLKVTYSLLTICSIWIFFLAVSKENNVNQVFYAVIAQGITVLAYIWYLWILINYLFTARYMTIYSYKSTSPKLVRSGLSVCVTFFLNFLSVLYYALINRTDFKGYFQHGMFFFIAIALILMVVLIEMKLTYLRIPNSNLKKK